MDTFWRDIRFGARALVRSPGFTLAAVLTLILGIGGNTGMFRMVDFLVLNPLPWEHPATIVSLSEINLRLDASRRWVSTAKYPEWREQTRSFEGLAATRFRLVNLTDVDQLDVVPGAEVTPMPLRC